MKKNFLLQAAFSILFLLVSNVANAQKCSEKVKSEITKTLETWNSSCKNANLEEVMGMFDTTQKYGHRF